MPEDLAVGLAGFGRFARLHARVLADIPGVRIAAVCDTEPAARERAVRDLGDGVAVYDEVEALLDHERVDALDIVTDEASHGAQALAALERDVPVFVEKPLATSVEEACAVAEAANRRSLPVVVGYVSRFDHRYALVRDAIRGGRLGRVAAVSARRAFSRAWFAGFGTRVHPVFESMIHDIDLALWYAGAPVRTVYAQAVASEAAPRGDVPDVLTAILTTAEGQLLTVQSAWLLPEGRVLNLPAAELDPLELEGTIEAQVDVVGSSGCARVVLEEGPRIWTDSRAVSTSGLWPAVHGRVEGAIRAELAHFVDCARRREPSALVPVADGVAAVEVADAIVRSAASGVPVRLR
jgi:predicted dehydrogenase